MGLGIISILVLLVLSGGIVAINSGNDGARSNMLDNLQNAIYDVDKQNKKVIQQVNELNRKKQERVVKALTIDDSAGRDTGDSGLQAAPEKATLFQNSTINDLNSTYGNYDIGCPSVSALFSNTRRNNVFCDTVTYIIDLLASPKDETAAATRLIQQYASKQELDSELDSLKKLIFTNVRPVIPRLQFAEASTVYFLQVLALINVIQTKFSKPKVYPVLCYDTYSDSEFAKKYKGTVVPSFIYVLATGSSLSCTHEIFTATINNTRVKYELDSLIVNKENKNGWCDVFIRKDPSDGNFYMFDPSITHGNNVFRINTLNNLNTGTEPIVYCYKKAN